MPKKTVSSEVESSGYDAVQALAKLAGVVKGALADGFQPGADVAPIAGEALQDLPAVFAQIPQFGTDAAEDKLEFAEGVNVAVYDLIKALTK